ncbi:MULTISPECIES: HDOD domain-containing protein [unclassified Acidovorax]|uniref:HDOD domain-containing protein n=1 Tax=unclassified Acidovorax TaxID=2684926 RepID=UPI002882F442|nr:MULTISPECIES: HDOD domain-containing protein [unclassified Acidovorax]
MELNALLAVPVALPSLPKAVALLMTELASAEPDLRRVNQLFGTDPAMAARLLQEANSPAFGAQGQVAGIPEALALLGLRQLRTLVASAPLGTTSRSVPGVNLQQFWRYSLRTAKLARSLAGLVHQSPLAAYTAGLLHGVGELALHLADPERAQSINTLIAPLELRRARLEQRLMGYSYAHISAGMARRWQLPPTVVDALQHHCAPFDNGVYEPLAGVLHLSAWRVRAGEAEMGDKELAVSFPGEVGVTLGLDIDMVLQQDPIDWTVRPDAGDFV